MERYKFKLVIIVLFSVLVLDVSSEQATSIAPMAKVEQQVLYSVIQDFVGKWWNGSELYPDPCGWTQIQGVSCDVYDGLWYITVLNIGPVFENSLECAKDAKFSPLLFELKHLRSLSFFGCFQSHQEINIPSNNWENLAGTLETLEFRSNPGLVGPIPANFGHLINLQSLVLADNSLTGLLPSELGHLSNLKRLVLSGNRLSGRIPDTLGANLRQLLILDVCRNSLTGTLPPSLGYLSSLLKLDLSNNQLLGSLPQELSRLDRLTLLDLRNNNFSGPFAQAIQGIASLQYLLLSNNALLGDNLLELQWQKLENLTTLDLAHVGLTGTIPESMASLKRLRYLALNNNQLSGTVSSKFAALPSLSTLYLNGNNLTGQLHFSTEFYQKFGVRFASWDNPHLCYIATGMTTRDGPYGVKQCKEEQQISNFSLDSGDKMNSLDIVHSSSLLASFGPLGYSTCGAAVIVYLFFFMT